MQIDIHRHSSNTGGADRVLRNLFHNQHHEIRQNEMYSFGLHPWHVKAETLEADIEMVCNAAAHRSVLAVGETGLDKVKPVDINVQEQAFRQQIEIAMEHNKPMIIHCVKAYNELLQLYNEYNPAQPWVVHWFYASPEMAMQLIERGFYLSFGLTLFHEKSKACRAFKKIPLERILLETDDAEYTIEQIYRKASELLSIELNALEKQIEMNFATCFGIEL